MLPLFNFLECLAYYALMLNNVICIVKYIELMLKEIVLKKSVYVYSKIEEAFILFLKILLTFQIYTLPLASLFSGVIIWFCYSCIIS